MKPENIRLSEFIKAKEKFAAQFAKKCGITASTIQNILVGRNSFGIETLRKVKAAYPDLDINYIVTGEPTDYSFESILHVTDDPGNKYEKESENDLLQRINELRQLTDQQTEKINIQSKTISALEKTIATQDKLIKSLEK